MCSFGGGGITISSRISQTSLITTGFVLLSGKCVVEGTEGADGGGFPESSSVDDHRLHLRPHHRRHSNCTGCVCRWVKLVILRICVTCYLSCELYLTNAECPRALLYRLNWFSKNHAKFMIALFSIRADPFMSSFSEQQSMKTRMRHLTPRCSKFLFTTTGHSGCPNRSSQRILSACLPSRASFLLPTFKKRFFVSSSRPIFCSLTTFFLLSLGLQLNEFTSRKLICLCTSSEFSCFEFVELRTRLSWFCIRTELTVKRKQPPMLESHWVFARLDLPLSDCRSLHILTCSGTIFLRSPNKHFQVNLWSHSWLHLATVHLWLFVSAPSQKWHRGLGHRPLPAEVCHAGGRGGSAPKLHAQQRNGPQRLQTVPLRPAGGWGWAAVHRSRLFTDLLKTCMQTWWQTDGRSRAAHWSAGSGVEPRPRSSPAWKRVSQVISHPPWCDWGTVSRSHRLCALIKPWCLLSYSQTEVNTRQLGLSSRCHQTLCLRWLSVKAAFWFPDSKLWFLQDSLWNAALKPEFLKRQLFIFMLVGKYDLSCPSVCVFLFTNSGH